MKIQTGDPIFLEVCEQLTTLLISTFIYIILKVGVKKALLKLVSDLRGGGCVGNLIICNTKINKFYCKRANL